MVDAFFSFSSFGRHHYLKMVNLYENFSLLSDEMM